MTEKYLLISRAARDRYHFDKSLFSIRGNVVFANFRQARFFADKINQSRTDENKIRPSDLNAAGLIHEIYHVVMDQLRKTYGNDIFGRALYQLQTNLGEKVVKGLLLDFVAAFPPPPVYVGHVTPADWLGGQTGDLQNTDIALEELILLRLANQNPAFAPLKELFDDSFLHRNAAYRRIFAVLNDFMDDNRLETNDGRRENLLALLAAPFKFAPTSLVEQLQFIQNQWGISVDGFSLRLLTSGDFIHEEDKAIYAAGEQQNQGKNNHNHGNAGPEAFTVKTYTQFADREQPDAFSDDLDWMPSVVLMAKSTLVWLDQLSKKFKQEIRRLDQIPNEILDELAGQGFNSLWLIGIWERGNASRRIKQMNGTHDAESSAYSLMDYNIANELGGYQAYENLFNRCAQRGIRLACDMVPNHTAIDSDWVAYHPDWFVQAEHSPYPSYTFNGPDLSSHPGVGVFLDDHYFNETDAAVVFKRVDYNTGDVRYLYHGNDGTTMPWNDTAQLNYLRADVREAVIQTIIRVAKMFPVIRFDAAMTLVKQHIQRLWFPEPGEQNTIASRPDHAKTAAQIDELMPAEFWREVVDRVAIEAPNTLLLAEAFWMMESYFVRSLGMHRVYNSAFMHMFMTESNKEYRDSVKNTLVYDPQILKRYVNFMNNPDEETAVAQFGKEGKYFGVTTILSTMPGLPLFGHGQVEGFSEKYGMEYRYAKHDEIPDEHLIWRHEQEIFPLLKKRHIFAEVDHFLFYDLLTHQGIDENVYAYSNRFQNEHSDEHSFVIFNNTFGETAGWINHAAPFVKKHGDGSTELQHKNLSAGLNLPAYDSDQEWLIFFDQISKLTYIRSIKEIHEKGLFFQLGAYEYAVYLNFKTVADPDGKWQQLAGALNGHGVPDIDKSLALLDLVVIHDTFQGLMPLLSEEWSSEFDNQAEKLIQAVADHENIDIILPIEVSLFQETWTSVDQRLADLKMANKPDTDRYLWPAHILKNIETNPVLPIWLRLSSILAHLESLLVRTESSLITEWHLDDIFVPFFTDFTHHKNEADAWIQLLSLNLADAISEDILGDEAAFDDDDFASFENLDFTEADKTEIDVHGELIDPFSSLNDEDDAEDDSPSNSPSSSLNSVVESPAVQQFLNVNTWEDKQYFAKENWELFTLAFWSMQWIIDDNSLDNNDFNKWISAGGTANWNWQIFVTSLATSEDASLAAPLIDPTSQTITNHPKSAVEPATNDKSHPKK